MSQGTPSEGRDESEILISEDELDPSPEDDPGDGNLENVSSTTPTVAVTPSHNGKPRAKLSDVVLQHLDTNPPEKKPKKKAKAPAREMLSLKDVAMYKVSMLTGDVKNEGRKLYFKDGKRRIDYVLVWSGKEKAEEKAHNQKLRDTFIMNLEEEGLQSEYDIKEGRAEQFVKIHATFEVLTRYAEVMKIRMPMKEQPEKVRSENLWEIMTEWTAKLIRPFEHSPDDVPVLPKKFTCVYQRDKDYLFAMTGNEETFFSHATRSRITDYILRRKKYTESTNDAFTFVFDAQVSGITRLISSGVYLAAYPLHEGSWKPWTKPSIRRLLYEHWAHWRNFYKVQPLDYIRTYFGEKIGFYFAWLGFYTWMLLPASIVGLIVFIYSVSTLNENLIAQEICDIGVNITMCPQCDFRCPYWTYNSSCTHARASHLFDNGATVFFAVFMALWGTVFLEFWKREQASIQFRWNLLNFEAEEQPPRPEYLMRTQNSRYKKKHKVTGLEEPYLPFWRRRVPVYLASFSAMLFLVMIAVAVVIGVVVYRMAVLSALYVADEELLYRNASMVTTATAACINLVIIFILNFVYEAVASKLTDWECLRTQSEYENSLTIKLYSLQFVNYYSSIVYIALFKGRFIGRPGAYNTLFGARQEECQAGGCLIELAIQLAIIFVGKQLIQNNIMEICLPRIKKQVKLCFMSKEEKKSKDHAPWEKDYLLEALGPRGLFFEYLEMLLQFGFVTIFVAAFPLAPLFALLNNIIEIRADANKFVTQLRRPMASRADNIGIWYEILYAISRLAVFTNAFIIAFTSGFINRFVYLKGPSPDHTLKGYTNWSLSFFDVNDFTPNATYEFAARDFPEVKYCRYIDHRVPPWQENKYEYSVEFWHVLAAQFIFIVVFENFVVLTTCAIAYLIPDQPRKLREQVRREAFITNEMIIKTELEYAKGRDTEPGATSEWPRRRDLRNAFNRLMSQTDPEGDSATVDGMVESDSRV